MEKNWHNYTQAIPHKKCLRFLFDNISTKSYHTVTALLIRFERIAKLIRFAIFRSQNADNSSAIFTFLRWIFLIKSSEKCRSQYWILRLQSNGIIKQWTDIKQRNDEKHKSINQIAHKMKQATGFIPVYLQQNQGQNKTNWACSRFIWIWKTQVENS